MFKMLRPPPQKFIANPAHTIQVYTTDVAIKINNINVSKHCFSFIMSKMTGVAWLPLQLYVHVCVLIILLCRFVCLVTANPFI